MRRGLLGAALLLVAGCAPAGPRPIDFGRESCAFCRMTVSDPRFGAELVTAKGRVYTFDSIECLASYYLANRAGVGSMWVGDPARPGTLIPAEQTRYSRGPGGAEGGAAMALALVPDPDGALDWPALLALVERQRTAPPSPGDR